MQFQGAQGVEKNPTQNSSSPVSEKKTELNLKKLEETLCQVGKVQYNDYSLWLKAGKLELVIFPGG